MKHEDEFAGMTAEEIRAGALAAMRGTPDTPLAESEQELKDTRLRVGHVMGLRADQATPDDRNFLAAEIRKGLANL